MNVGVQEQEYVVGLPEATGELPPVRGGRLALGAQIVGIVGLALAMVVGLLVAGRAWERHSTFEGLKPSQPEYIDDIPMTRDEPEFSFGVASLEFPGEEITVLSVSALTSPNLEYLGAGTISPRQQAAAKAPWGFGVGFKVAGKPAQHPIGTPISASETGSTVYDDEPEVMVVANFRLASGDEGALNGLLVTYRVGDKVTTELVRHGAVACLRPGPIPRTNNGGQSCFRDAGGGMNGPTGEAILYRFGLLPERDLGY